MTASIPNAAAVSHVTPHGFGLLLGNQAVEVLFAHFLWFKNASAEQITHVEWPTPNHLYWPGLDVDLSVESLKNPGAFPLVSKVGRKEKFSEPSPT